MKKLTIGVEDRSAKKPPYIATADWEDWLNYWDREDVKVKSATAKRCRMSEPEGVGTGRVTHRGGSKSTVQYAHELAMERGVPVKNCMYEAYSKNHIKPDGTFTDLKSANIHSRILDYIEEQRLEGREVTLNEAYLHVVKPDQKNKMFGVGDLAKEIANDLFDGTSSQFHSEAACQDRYSQMEQQLQEGREEHQRLGEQTRQLQEALKTQQQLIEKIMSQQRSDSGHPPLP